MFLLDKKKHFKSMIKFLTIRNRGHVGKGRRIKDKANRRKEIIKVRAEIIKIENRRTIERIKETKSDT